MPWALSDLVSINPVADVKMPREGAGFRPWTDQDIAQFIAHWPDGSRARLAIALLLYTGQRRSDVVRMGRQHVRDGLLHVTQKKGGGKVSLAIPLHPAPCTLHPAPCSSSGFSTRSPRTI